MVVHVPARTLVVVVGEAVVAMVKLGLVHDQVRVIADECLHLHLPLPLLPPLAPLPIVLFLLPPLLPLRFYSDIEGFAARNRPTANASSLAALMKLLQVVVAEVARGVNTVGRQQRTVRTALLRQPLFAGRSFFTEGRRLEVGRVALVVDVEF